MGQTLPGVCSVVGGIPDAQAPVSIESACPAAVVAAAAAGSALAPLPAHDGTVVGVASDSTNKLLVTAGADGALRVWDFRKQKLHAELPLGSSATHLVLHPGSGLAAVACVDRTVRLVDIEAARVVRRFSGHWCVRVYVWGGGAHKSCVHGTRCHVATCLHWWLVGRRGACNGCTCRPCLSVAELASRCSADRSGCLCCVWRTVLRCAVACCVLHSDRLTDVAISSDCRWLLTAGMDCTLRVWDIPASQCLQVRPGGAGRGASEGRASRRLSRARLRACVRACALPHAASFAVDTAC